MTYLKLTRKDGQKFIYLIDVGWEISDKGNEPAHWVNHREGRNMDAKETFTEIESQLINNLRDNSVWE